MKKYVVRTPGRSDIAQFIAPTTRIVPCPGRDLVIHGYLFEREDGKAVFVFPHNVVAVA
jgi:hypothetical protein